MRLLFLSNATCLNFCLKKPVFAQIVSSTAHPPNPDLTSYYPLSYFSSLYANPQTTHLRLIFYILLGKLMPN